MSRLWSSVLKFLGWLGSIRFAGRGHPAKVFVGDPKEVDVLHSMEWTKYRRPEALCKAYSPLEDSPWLPFHCVTLFAALDNIPLHAIGPAPANMFTGPVASPIAVPRWTSQEVMALVDLPGPLSVTVGAWLCANAGFQTVCTFDNWPHERGLVRPEIVLASLLRYAELVSTSRQFLLADAPPVWLCDSLRLGNRTGKPQDFDNRYFLDDCVLPGPDVLKSAKIRRVVYVAPPDRQETADLSLYFQLLQRSGFELLSAAIDDEQSWNNPVPFTPKTSTFKRQGFFRASAGGFGAPIPEPSSSSG